MKQENGFTLIELMVVTVLAVMLTLYMIPRVMDLLDTSKDELYKAQIQTIEKAAKDYFLTESDYLPTDKKDARFLSIDMLFKHHHLETNEIIDPRTEKKMKGCVLVKPNGKDYSYTYEEETCQQLSKDYSPTLKVKGKNIYQIEVNSVYSFPEVTAKDILGEKITVTGPYMKGKLITNLDTTKLGKEYVLEYQAKDTVRNIVGTKKIKVRVVDTTPPVIKVNGKTKSFTYKQPLELKKLESFHVECTDNSETKPTLKVTSTVSRLKGKGTITYLAKDSSGNITALVVTVEVTDRKNPYILMVEGNRSNYKPETIHLTVTKEKHLGNTLQYSFDGGKTWQTKNTREIAKNGVVEIQTKDMFGNKSSLWKEEITTIDQTSPTQPKVTLKTQNWRGDLYHGSWTNTPVYLQIQSEDEDSSIDYYEYSKDGVNFKKMNSMMIFDHNMNEIYYFRSVDQAGNKSDRSMPVAIKIDKQNITAPTIQLTSTTGHKLKPGKKVWTSGEIHIDHLLTTKKTGSPIVYYEVSKDDKYTFSKAQENYVFNENMRETYYFRSVDAAGNKSPWTKPIYIFIDRVRPSIPQVTLKIKNKHGQTYPSGAEVGDDVYMKVVSVDSGSGVDYYQISKDGVTWETLEKTEVLFTENMNTDIYIRAVDKVGNVSLPYQTKIYIQK